MNIYIPTIRAGEHQRTFHQLAAAGLRPWLVPDTHDFPGNGMFKGNVVTFPGINGKGIAAKRQAILEHSGMLPFCMIDDDLTLKRVLKNGKIIDASANELNTLFTIKLPKLLTKYAHGGIGQRLFINSTFKYGYPHHVTHGHYRQVLCFNPALFGGPVKYEFDSCEDLWVFTQLCMQGRDWFTVNSFCIQEKNSKAAPPTWSIEHKRAVMDNLFRQVPKEFVSMSERGKRIAFRKLCMANGGKGK